MDDKQLVEQRMEMLLQSDYKINHFEVIDKGWELFKKYPFGFIGYFLIMLVAGTFASSIDQVAGSILSSVLNTIFLAGFFYMARHIYHGGTPTFEIFFEPFKSPLQIVWYAIVSLVLIVIGLVFLLVPGIYLAIAYSFALPLIVFYKIDFWPAMEVSRKLITKNWFSFFGLFLLFVLVALAGVVALVIGLLVAIPLIYCSLFVVFEEVFGSKLNEAVSIDDDSDETGYMIDSRGTDVTY